MTNGLSVGWVVGVDQGWLGCGGVRAVGNQGRLLSGGVNGGWDSWPAYSTDHYDVSRRIWMHAAAAMSNASGRIRW